MLEFRRVLCTSRQGSGSWTSAYHILSLLIYKLPKINGSETCNRLKLCALRHLRPDFEDSDHPQEPGASINLSVMQVYAVLWTIRPGGCNNMQQYAA
jgi:hypothetical protein